MSDIKSQNVQFEWLEEIKRYVLFFLAVFLVSCSMPSTGAAAAARDKATAAAKTRTKAVNSNSKKTSIILKVKKATARSVTLKWSKISGARKYHVYRATGSKSKLKKYKTVSPPKRTFKDKKISAKKKYYYMISAIVTDPGTDKDADTDKNADADPRSEDPANDQSKAQPNSNIIIKPQVRGDFKRGSVYGPYLSSKQLKKLEDILADIICRYQTEQLSKQDRIYFAHDYIAYRTVYSYSGSQVASALGPLKYGKAHCQGYSRAFVALTAAMGVKSRYIHASARAANPAHQWNMVKLKGKWYLMDVQCNDSSGLDVVFLMGKDRLKGFFQKAYRYNKRGKPKLAGKSYPARDYYFKF